MFTLSNGTILHAHEYGVFPGTINVVTSHGEAKARSGDVLVTFPDLTTAVLTGEAFRSLIKETSAKEMKRVNPVSDSTKAPSTTAKAETSNKEQAAKAQVAVPKDAPALDDLGFPVK